MILTRASLVFAAGGCIALWLGLAHAADWGPAQCIGTVCTEVRPGLTGAFAIRGPGNTYNLPLMELPGLAGFKLDFLKDDHELQYFGFQPVGQANLSEQVSVLYGDKNWDDGFRWMLDRRMLPPGTRSLGCRIHDGKGAYDVYLGEEPNVTPVLTAFWMEKAPTCRWVT